MNTFTRRTALAVALFTVAGAAAIGYIRARRSETGQAPPLARLLAQLPAGAPSLFYADLAGLRQSGFYRHRHAPLPDPVPENEYKEFVQATGFDFETDLDRIALAAWPDSMPGTHHQPVAVAEGRFDQPRIRAYVQRSGRIEEQAGREVLVFPGNRPSEWNSLTFLDAHTVMVVQGPGIAPALSPDSINPSSDPVRERVPQVAGADIFLITRVPAIPSNFNAGGIESTSLANLLRSVQWLTLAARPEGDNLRVSLEGDCASGTDARQIQSALESLRLLAQAAMEKNGARSQDSQALQLWISLVKAADITQSGDRVRVLLELPPEILDYAGPKNAR